MTRDGARPFVGRARELRLAAGILAAEDEAGAILIGGESGLGKTRLAEEIIAAAPQPTTTLRALAVPRPTPIPYELIHSALERLEPGRESLPVERVRAEAEALRNANDGPTIFLFEDLHWADPESLEVIDRMLVAGPLGSTVLITYRPNALHPGHPTSSFLRRAERRSHVVQFRLEPLRRDEVAEYLRAAGRSTDASTVDHVHGRTGGNPLLLTELVAATADDDDLTAGLPWTLAEMLRPEIDGLPPAELAVVEAIAVLGTDVGFDLVAAAVEAEEDQLLASLRALVDKGILVESGPDRFGFRHDMVREAVADGLFTRQHRRIHAAVHDALLAAGSDDAAALVAHASGAGRTKEAADIARDAALGALDEGRSHQALAFAEQALLVHADDVDLLRVAVVAGWMVGQDRAALDHLGRWEELATAGPSDQAEVLHHRVRLLWEEDDLTAADRTATELAALADRMDDGVALVQALADLAQHHMLRGRSDESVTAADRAIAVAGRVGPAADAAVRQAKAERASAVVWRDAESDALSDAITGLLSVATDAERAEDHVVAARALHNVPIWHPAIEPRNHLERMRRASQRAGLTCLGTDTFRCGLLWVTATEGDREAFSSLLEATIDDLGDDVEVLRMAAFAAIDRSDYEAAERYAERLATKRHPPDWPRLCAEAVRAIIDLERGDPAPADAWLEAGAAHPARRKLALFVLAQFLTPVLDAGLGHRLPAMLAVDDPADDGETDDGGGSVKPTMEAALVSGVAAELVGDRREAERRYAAALADGTRRLPAVDVEIHLGRARVASALGSDDRPHLEAAARRLALWPGRQRDRVVALLGTPSVDEAPSSLTPREREVAELVTRGLTNGGIADQLFISTKTASVHVSNILAKLNMASRTEIAAWVAKGGLDP